MVKKMTAPATTKQTVPHTTQRNHQRASTSPAMVEPCSRSQSVDMLGRRSRRGGPRSRASCPAREPPERRDPEHGPRAPEPRESHDDEAVLPGRRVVREAVEERLIELRPDLPLPRLDEAEAHITRRVLDAVEVARDLAVGREDDDRG